MSDDLNNIMNTNFDVTDPRLYNYDFNSFSLVPLQEKTNANLVNAISDLIISKSSDIELMNKIFNSKETSEYVLNIPAEVAAKIKSGDWKFMKSSNSGNVRSNIVDQNNKIVKNLDVSEVTKSVPELGNLTQLAAIQSQLVELSDQIETLNGLVERVETNQYNDRIAGFFSARQTVIEALSASDQMLAQQLFVDAIKISNETIAKMMLSIRQDALELANPKTSLKNAKKIDNLLQNSIGILNASVQLNMVSYSNLHENKMLTASMMNYRSFIDQVLLKEDDNLHKSVAWLIDNGREGDEHDFTNLIGDISLKIENIISDNTPMIEDDEYEKIESK